MIAGKKTSVAALMLLVTGAAFIPAMAFLPSLGRAKTAGSICTLRVSRQKDLLVAPPTLRLILALLAGYTRDFISPHPNHRQ
jgi:hypothetical protein